MAVEQAADAAVDRVQPGAGRALVVPDFFEGAAELRETFDHRFRRRREDDQGSFVWDYWHVPAQYTYFRTFSDRYFPEPLMTAFLDRLRSWGREVLGCGSPTIPWFSYYIDGCVQELHADVPHGPWAYVLSLTHWEERSFTGGETFLLRPECLDFWRGFSPDEGFNEPQLVEQIPSPFNQLTVFDARIPHGVRPVQGTRDPLDSRVVLHGWFEHPHLMVSDDLEASQKALAALQMLSVFVAKRLAPELTGLLTVRVELDGSGRARETRVLTNTLVSTSGDPDGPSRAVTSAVEALGGLSVPGASEQSWATVPFRVPPA